MISFKRFLSEAKKFTVQKFYYSTNKFIDKGSFDDIEQARIFAKDLLGSNHANQIKILDTKTKKRISLRK